MGVLIGFPLIVCGATAVWDGAGTNAYWSNPSNWVSRTVPMPGDDLVFPETASRDRRMTTNDLPTGTPFNLFTLDGIDYRFDGNLIVLNGGINRMAGWLSLWLPVRLGASQTFMAYSNVTMGLYGNIDLNEFELTLAGNADYSVWGVIGGSGSLTYTGTKRLTLLSSNHYTGPTRLTGFVTLLNARALGDPSGGTEIAQGGKLWMQSTQAFDEPFTLGGGIQVGGEFTWNGTVNLVGANVDFTDAGSLGITLNGVISGVGGINEARWGSAPLTLNGDNTYTGSNRITYGVFIVNGQQPASAVFLGTGPTPAILGGRGRVGAITCPDGQVSPGTNGPARLGCGGVTFGEPAKFVVEINGVGAGTGYDQLDVAGPVSLGNATLVLTNRFAASGGEQFVIINNDGSDSVNGTFKGFPEGTLWITGGVKFRISYQGGDGNDVVLTAQPLPPPATGVVRVWDGGGANNLWSTRENWVGNIAPVQGDDLEFPGGAAQSITVNDFPEGTTFNSIRLSAGDWRLQGASVALNAGIVATQAAGTIEIALPLYLNTDQAFISGSAPVRVLSVIETAGSTLTVAPQGEMQISGVISGWGNISKTGSGRLVLLTANTYEGTTEVRAGELVVRNSLALGGVNFGTTVRNNALLTTYTDLNEPLALDGRLRSLRDTEPSTNNITGLLTLPGPLGGELQVSNILLLGSAMAGSGALRKTGAGTVLLNGTNQSATGTYVSNGIFIVNGFYTSSVYMINGTLGGTGWIANIYHLDQFSATNRVVSPGLDRPGTLRAGEASFSWFCCAARPTLKVQINGTRPGIDYDQLRIDDYGNVREAILDISLGYTPAVGDRFIIIDKGGEPYSVNGFFRGLRQGAVFMVGNTQFRIIYNGGDTNDVELIVTEGRPLTRVWDGGGTNALWSNPQNWLDDVAPMHRDTVVFPETGAARFANTNDYPAGSHFTVIVFDGPFQIYGNPIVLRSGILANQTATVGLPITFNTDLSFISDGGFYGTNVLEVLGTIDLAEHDLNFLGDGTTRVKGQIHSGNLIKSESGKAELYGNNLHRQTRVLEGELAIYHTNALAGVDFPTEVAEGARLRSGIGNVVISEPLNLAGTLDSFTTCTWAGAITLQGPRVTMLGGGVITGLIQGSAGFVKAGSGSLFLMADNTYTGATVITNVGSLYVHGNQPQSPVILLSGNLGGHGLAGDVYATNWAVVRIDPGNGMTTATLDTATFTCRSLTAGPAATLGWVFNGLGVAERDYLKVSDALVLNGCRAEVRMRFRPDVGQRFVLIENEGSDAVTGAFRDLPEGGVFVSSNMLFQITYAGGDGNDVALTRVAAPPATFSWIVRQTNSIVLRGIGISNMTYSVQAASNLNAPVFWEAIGTCTAGSLNRYQFMDMRSPLLPMRFYRVVSP